MMGAGWVGLKFWDQKLFLVRSALPPIGVQNSPLFDVQVLH